MKLLLVTDKMGSAVSIFLIVLATFFIPYFLVYYSIFACIYASSQNVCVHTFDHVYVID